MEEERQRERIDYVWSLLNSDIADGLRRLEQDLVWLGVSSKLA
jgi:hypothetical protein